MRGNGAQGRANRGFPDASLPFSRGAAAPMSTGPILFFDGECGLCARSVRWCLRHDRRRVMRFAPLQGETYAAISTPGKPTDMQSMVLSDADGLHVRSDAVLRLLHHIGGPWAVLGILGKLLPRRVRDAIYARIAARRMLWFGPADRCAFVNESERARFLK